MTKDDDGAIHTPYENSNRHPLRVQEERCSCRMATPHHHCQQPCICKGPMPEPEAHDNMHRMSCRSHATARIKPIQGLEAQWHAHHEQVSIQTGRCSGCVTRTHGRRLPEGNAGPKNEEVGKRLLVVSRANCVTRCMPSSIWDTRSPLPAPGSPSAAHAAATGPVYHI